jgi:Tol biopolymer transport system component
MRPSRSLAILASGLAGTALAACSGEPASETPAAETPAVAAHSEAARPAEPAGLWFKGEDQLANVRQLTFGGQNAEAYWSPDGQSLIFQATPAEGGCDQIYVVSADGGEPTLVSTGRGRTTCAYFLTNDRILYSSTHAADPACPPEPDHSRGYVWPLYDSYEVYSADLDGSNLVELTDNEFYDAEATVSPDGQWILFTSTRDGDIDLYRMRPDGSDVTRLTDLPGYDGGAFYSPDGTKICWRASRPTGEDLTDFRALLQEDLVRPSNLEIYWMNADGTGVQRVTDNGRANFAPYFTPDSNGLLFASNLGDERGRNFDIYSIGLDGDVKGLTPITTCSSFDSFPMFSPDGRRLAFASNRNGSVPGETNIFVADWITP